MNILVADDESLIRASLRSMLDELGMPVHVIGEARNGEEAIRFVTERQPDLVFVDIRMPKLNGLEVIAHGKTVSPHTKWIILSGYSEFQYAREAIRLGACNYLLKPISLEEVHDSLTHVQELHDAHIMERSRQIEHAIVSSIQGRSGVSQGDHLLETLHCKASVFYFDDFLCDHEEHERQQRFIETLRSLIHNQSLTNSLYSLAMSLPGGQPAILWAWPALHHHQALELQQKMERTVKHLLQDQLAASRAITTIQLEECSNLQTMVGQIEELQRVSSLRVLFPIGGVYPLSELSTIIERAECLPISTHVDNLRRLFRREDYLGYLKAVDCMEKEWNGALSADQHLWRRIHEYISRSLGITLEPGTCVDQASWFALLKNHGDRMLSQASRHDNSSKDIVQQVIAYVEQQYMHDIGIKQIADMFHVTPNYLSSLFHKKHGSTFLKYVTETRMLKAKELLLKEPHLKVQEVAEAVGYYSPRHFTKLFTEYTGCYPSEFRERNKVHTFL
ncbi:two-component system, response regulator YesN [Paenibacillus uliginis N3/975]|uniref:Two-component system, response regulator YesN n=1 Tax=Paenibacillus uliginis N3/975 TaxID=1313296 RepID=A0A1X7HCD4_9BACL|nr:response regulator [Paenibacillus uliginis]SMF83602.1 two-component system, response regulator YesN [Paenibacillus uliginis N3/975]